MNLSCLERRACVSWSRVERICRVVGDVCISRRDGGRHYVLPLSSDIQVRARRIGFDNLTPIRWHKVANIKMEASKSSRYL